MSGDRNSFAQALSASAFCLLIVPCLIGFVSSSRAQEPETGKAATADPAANCFRINNRIVTDDDRVTNSTTIFFDGLVYDFVDPNGQATVYDKANALLTVLDPSSRLQMRISVSDLEKDVEKKKEACRKSDNYFLNYLARPHFEEQSYDPLSGILIFRSDWVEYRFETVPLSDPVVAGLYYDYCQKSTLLNIRHSGASSPLIRAVINPVLEQYRRFPTKVALTLYPKGKILIATHSVMAESTHTFVRRLQYGDEQKIEQIKQYKKLFRMVSADDYYREVIAAKPQ